MPPLTRRKEDSIVKKILMYALALAMLAGFALVGCGGSDDTNARTSTPGEASVPSQPEPARSAPEENSEMLALFVDSLQEQSEAMSAIFGGSAQVDMTGEGTGTLRITYTLLDDSMGLSTEEIQTSMEAQEESLRQFLFLMEAAEIPSPALVVEWVGPDGKALYAEEYTL